MPLEGRSRCCICALAHESVVPRAMIACTVVLLSILILGGMAKGVHGSDSDRNCSAIPPYLPPTVVNTTQRLQALRQTMARHAIQAFIIPATDAHLSEYISPRDARLSWISGFTGSAGTAVVTQDRAVLWTDSRYWVQAERQMDCNWELQRESWISSIANWLILQVPEGKEIGFDPFLFSINTFEAYEERLNPANRTLKSIPNNLVDEVWTLRPPLLPDNLTRLPDSIVERTWQMKVQNIRQQMRDNPYKPTAVLLSALDETAWLFNLRGNDIPYNPFFYSYTLLSLERIWLFVHNERVPEELRDYLNTSCQAEECVQLPGYDNVRSVLENYLSLPDVRVWIGTEYTTRGLSEVIVPEEKLLVSSYSPVLITKAVKDEKEQQILKDAHVLWSESFQCGGVQLNMRQISIWFIAFKDLIPEIRDAVAVIQLLVWLENNVPKGGETELTAARHVDTCRSKQLYSRGPSFQTISASGPNAALAHYSPTELNSRQLRVDEMYLVDSGGQYLDGTTDITRTVHWGTPTDMEKEAYTRVLMGNIEISRTVFPSGTKGINMEMLGRRALWEVGLNYGHGTGHGVGNYFGVHEWPVGFQSNNIPFQKGMFTSIEPGYYKENHFGIRIEDVAVVAAFETKYGNNYLTFDTVSLVPYDRKLIDTSIMSPQQIQWLNSYYERIREVVGQELQRQDLQVEWKWMMKHTEPFGPSNGVGMPAQDSPSVSVALLSFLLLQRLVY